MYEFNYIIIKIFFNNLLNKKYEKNNTVLQKYYKAITEKIQKFFLDILIEKCIDKKKPLCYIIKKKESLRRKKNEENYL